VDSRPLCFATLSSSFSFCCCIDDVGEEFLAPDEDEAPEKEEDEESEEEEEEEEEDEDEEEEFEGDDLDVEETTKSRSSRKQQPTTTLDAKARLASNLLILSGPELGHVSFVVGLFTSDRRFWYSYSGAGFFMYPCVSLASVIRTPCADHHDP